MARRAKYPSVKRRGKILFKPGEKVKVLWSKEELCAFADELVNDAKKRESKNKGRRTTYSRKLRQRAYALRIFLLPEATYTVTQSGNKMVGLYVNKAEVVIPTNKIKGRKKTPMVVAA